MLTPRGRAEAECPPQPARLASCLEVRERRRRALATRKERVSVTPTSGKGALAAEESETLDPLPSLSDANFNRVGLMPQRDQIRAPGRGPLWLCLCPLSPLASLPPGHPAHIHPTPFSPQSSLTRNSLFGSSYSFTQRLKKIIIIINKKYAICSKLPDFFGSQADTGASRSPKATCLLVLTASAPHRPPRPASGEWTVRASASPHTGRCPSVRATEHLSGEWTRPGREETLSVRHVWGPEDFDSNNSGDAAGSSRGSRGPRPSVCSEAGEGASSLTPSAPCKRGVSSVPRCPRPPRIAQ